MNPIAWIPFLEPYPFWVKGLSAMTIIFAVATLLSLVFFAPKQPEMAPIAATTINISSKNQSGGVTAHTVNVTPGRAAFTQLIQDEILKTFPKVPVDLRVIGGASDQTIGNEVQQFLINNGFEVRRFSIGMMAPPPDRPYSVQPQTGRTIFIVAPSAR